MLDKRIYNKTIAISEKDLDFIKNLKKTVNFNKKSLAGINSFIINYFKNYGLPEMSQANGVKKTPKIN